MATPIAPPNGKDTKGKHYYTMWKTVFEIDTKYIPIKPIGRGAYGVVCSAINRETNERVAIKKINNVFENSGDTVRIVREMMLLRQIKHENVIVLKDVMMAVNRNKFNDVYLVYELMETDLRQVIKSSHPLSPYHIKYFMFELLSGLQYLHSANILHRDLKPDNLLVNSNCDMKICDFGMARTKTGSDFMTEYVVTRWYRAPEILLGCKNYGTPVDVWSAGCVFAEILGRKPIFPGKDFFNQLNLITSILGSPTEADIGYIQDVKTRKFIDVMPFKMGMQLSELFPNAEPLAVDLLKRMLVFDPAKRITVDQAFEHPYLSELCDPMFNPCAEIPVILDINELIDDCDLREMILDEMLYYHREAAR